MLVNIHVFFCFTATTAPICVNTSVHQIEQDCFIVTSATQLQRHYVITAALLIQRQHVNDMNTLLERQSRRTTSTRQCNIKAPLERRRRRTTSTR